MIIITGLGRCGTSVLAQFVSRMGVQLGDTHWDSDINAGMEDSSIVNINRTIYYQWQLKNSINDLIIDERLKKRISDIKLQCMKDPRFTWPGVLQVWWRVRQDLKFIVLERNLEDIVASRKFMHESTKKLSTDCTDTRGYSINRLEDDKTIFDSSILLYDVPCTKLKFPDFLDDIDDVLKKFRELGLELNREKSLITWENLVDKKLVGKFKTT